MELDNTTPNTGSPLEGDLALYRDSINITDIQLATATTAIATTISIAKTLIFVISYEFLAQYADGQRWVKNSTLYTASSPITPDTLERFKADIANNVKQARQVLKQTKLNGDRAVQYARRPFHA